MIPGQLLVVSHISVKWHFLNEAYTNRILFGERYHREDVVDIAAIHHYRIELGRDSGGQQGFKSRPNLREAITTGDLVESVAVQAVDTEIYGMYAQCFKLRYIFFRECTISR